MTNTCVSESLLMSNKLLLDVNIDDYPPGVNMMWMWCDTVVNLGETMSCWITTIQKFESRRIVDSVVSCCVYKYRSVNMLGRAGDNLYQNSKQTEVKKTTAVWCTQDWEQSACESVWQGFKLNKCIYKEVCDRELYSIITWMFSSSSGRQICSKKIKTN